MKVEEHVPLSSLTTFKVGGLARYVLACESLEDLNTALAFIRERGVPFVVLGEGSNVLPTDEGYSGALIIMRTQGITSTPVSAGVEVIAEAGESWDALVRHVARKQLWGMENLAGIPGTVGAAPVQNIGAYGMELASILSWVEVLDVRTGELRRIAKDECGFGYRDSRFKHEPELIIVRVACLLTENGSPRTDYADLTAAKAEGKDVSSPQAIGETVRGVRAKKFPDLREYGTAGSFFKNPVMSEAEYQALSERYRTQAEAFGGIPRFALGDQVKVPLAFILDKLLGLRGYELGPTFLFGNQPLVLVATKKASAHDVEVLAEDIEARVHAATGISIEREVRFIDAHEVK